MTTLYSWRVEPHWVEIVERDLPIAYLPDSLAGRKLVQISDLHIGNLVDDDYIASAVSHACSLGDILVITGDFMSSQAAEQVDHVARVLESSHRPPALGTYSIFGNHDYGRTWNNHDVAARLHARLRDVGIPVL